jgi:hypothetical protein
MKIVVLGSVHPSPSLLRSRATLYFVIPPVPAGRGTEANPDFPPRCTKKEPRVRLSVKKGA